MSSDPSSLESTQALRPYPLPWHYGRTVHFADTDAAGVVYFARGLQFCHEAYEASLAAAGIDLGGFFQAAPYAVPIVEVQGEFFAPLRCGDRLAITLELSQAFAAPDDGGTNEFRLNYQVWLENEWQRAWVPAADSAAIGNLGLGQKPPRPALCAFTRHVCVDRTSRQRRSLPAELLAWGEGLSA